MQLNSAKARKTYMLIPAMPTPNGRLHLGHIGGPFLAVDVLARHLRLSGHDTIVLSGTDSYDSYITGQAVKENKTPEQICNHYHELIETDLKSMQIGLDRFVNPLSTQWAQTYRNWLDLMLNQLQDAGVTRTLEETVSLDDQTGRFLTGCWLPGFCPSCDAAVCGYFCEDCGAHFRPEEVIAAPQSKNKKQVNNIFMELPDSSDLDGRGIHQTILDVYKKFAESQKGFLRLTANSEWGLKISDEKSGDRFFNYPFAYAYALMLGQIAGQIAWQVCQKNAGTLDEQSNNALSSSSDIVTVAAFGIDNTIPVLGSIEGVTASLKQYKQFDYYLVNHFLDLDGSKFSTSRRHAIWVDEIINDLGASSDIIRLYLATIDIRTGTGNVEVSHLHSFYNSTVDWIEDLLVKGLANIHSGDQHIVDELIIDQLSALQEKQALALNPQDYRIYDAVAVINEWLELGSKLSSSSHSYFWWLKGLVILIYPFMPRLGENLWITLGYSAEPSLLNSELSQLIASKSIYRQI